VTEGSTLRTGRFFAALHSAQNDNAERRGVLREGRGAESRNTLNSRAPRHFCIGGFRTAIGNMLAGNEFHFARRPWGPNRWCKTREFCTDRDPRNRMFSGVGRAGQHAKLWEFTPILCAPARDAIGGCAKRETNCQRAIRILGTTSLACLYTFVQIYFGRLAYCILVPLHLVRDTFSVPQRDVAAAFPS
jgi:hypothetical protein